MAAITTVLRDKKLSRPLVLLVCALPLTALLLYWCHTTNSLALTSITYLSLFNCSNLVTCLVSVWAAKRQHNSKFSYGYERANVLAVFTVTMLLVLGGLAVVKDSLERLIEPPVVLTENLMQGVLVGALVHMLVHFGIDNKPLTHTSEVATPNWLQNALSDLGQSVCGYCPPLGRLLLYRVNPFSLMAIGCSFSLIISRSLIQLDDLHLADVAAALFNSALICGTMIPLCMYTGKILLQTAPEHILPLVDKSLKDALTLDGVVEIKNQHFWSIAFGSYAGSLHVRVRRDASEQEILSKVTACLSSQLNDLTVQVVKDEWNLPFSSGLTLAPPIPLNPSHIPGTGGSSNPTPGTAGRSQTQQFPQRSSPFSPHSHV